MMSLQLFPYTSESDYEAVAYMILEYDIRRKRCKCILGKSRIDPLKFVRVPRLEIQATVFSVKLMRQTIEEIKVKDMTEIHLLTDSMLVFVMFYRQPIRVDKL